MYLAILVRVKPVLIIVYVILSRARQSKSGSSPLIVFFILYMYCSWTSLLLGLRLKLGVFCVQVRSVALIALYGRGSGSPA